MPDKMFYSMPAHSEELSAVGTYHQFAVLIMAATHNREVHMRICTPTDGMNYRVPASDSYQERAGVMAGILEASRKEVDRRRGERPFGWASPREFRFAGDEVIAYVPGRTHEYPVIGIQQRTRNSRQWAIRLYTTPDRTAGRSGAYLAKEVFKLLEDLPAYFSCTMMERDPATILVHMNEFQPVSTNAPRRTRAGTLRERQSPRHWSSEVPLADIDYSAVEARIGAWMGIDRAQLTEAETLRTEDKLSRFRKMYEGVFSFWEKPDWGLGPRRDSDSDMLAVLRNHLAATAGTTVLPPEHVRQAIQQYDIDCLRRSWTKYEPVAKDKSVTNHAKFSVWMINRCMDLRDGRKTIYLIVSVWGANGPVAEGRYDQIVGGVRKVDCL